MDSIYLKPVWNKEELILAQERNQKFLNDFITLLNNKYNIPKQSLKYLGNEELTIAHSILLDTQKRVSFLDKGEPSPSNITPAEFFSAFQNVSTNNDLAFRNKILINFAATENKTLSKPLQSDLKQKSLKEYICENDFQTGDEKASINLEKIKDFFHILATKFFSFRGSTKLVHYINLDLRKFSQLSGFQYKKIIPPSIDLNWTSAEKEKVYQDLKNDFLQLESLNHFSHTQKNLLLLVIINSTNPWLYNAELVENYIKSSRKFIKKEKIETFINQGNYFRDINKLFFLALHEERVDLYEYQNGGFPIYNEGHWIIQNRFTLPRNYLTWAPSHPLPNHINKIQTPNPRFKQILKKRKNNGTQPFRILYTPIALSHICNIDIFNSFLPEHMHSHRTKINKLLSNITTQNIELNVKLKAFGNSFFDQYEFLTVPQMHDISVPTKLISAGTSSDYFPKFHLHFTDGMSTTFSESLAHNMPTIGFWNEDVLTPHEYLKDIFKELKNQKIIITNADDFLLALNRHIEEPNYWESRNIKIVVKEYISALAYNSQNWKKEIEKKIK